MASERIQRNVERLLEQAEEALSRLAWDEVLGRAQAALALDPDNADAAALVAAARRALRQAEAPAQPPAEPASASAASSPAAGHPVSFCDGRYEVRRFLGEGGRKRVYLAHDTKLDRDVAFALIKTDGLDEDGLARIRREAQAMGRLGDHPHIVAVYDIGDEGGQPYLVSQFMGGGDVEQLMARAPDHRAPLDVAVRIADEVCRALEYAHGHGIVHRDLKPGNVWLSDPSTSSGGRQAGRFRAGGGARSESIDPGRDDGRHRGLHGAGAGDGRRGDSSQRSLLAWGDALRAGNRPASVHRR